jgi:hypothetical protein
MPRLAYRLLCTGPDWVVDLLPKETAEQQERPAALLAALRISDDKYLPRDAGEFFESLRQQLYPLLLKGPNQAATAFVEGLLKPLRIDASAVAAAIGEVEKSWATLGQAGAQTLLRLCLPSLTASRYVPVLRVADELGRFWAWVGMMVWAQAGSLDEARPGAVDIAFPGMLTAVHVLPVLCRAGDRRDEACASALASIPESATPSSSYVGVVVGGSGPLPTSLVSAYSVVRGPATPGVARGGETRVVSWQKADSLFELASVGIDGPRLADAVRRQAASFVPPAAGEAA